MFSTFHFSQLIPSFLLIGLFIYIGPVAAQEADEGTKIMADIVNYQDNFGKSVSVDGNYSVIGAWTDDAKGPESGAAYIYFRADEKKEYWQMTKKLHASDGGAYHNFGGEVAVHGDYALVAAQGYDDFAGAVYVFHRNEGGVNNWGQIQILTAPDKKSGDYFGTSVAIHKDQLAIGAYGVDDKGRSAGAVYTFTLKNKKWNTATKIIDHEGAANDRFGSSVALDEETLIVGASRDNKAGSIIIFERENDKWQQALKIFSSDGKAGDRFGKSISLHNDYVAVGADGADDYMGAVYIFDRNLGGHNNWGEMKKIQALDGDANDKFGKTISIDGDYLLVGSEGHEMGMGATYLFKKDKSGENNWGIANKMMAMDGSPRDLFGASVALSGEDILIGAFQSDRKGGAYLFKVVDKSIFANKDD